MSKKFLPYYLSRAVISAVFGVLVAGFTWNAILFAFVLFGLFLLYLHSGWFGVDMNTPLTPLRRDQHGQMIQRKALIAAVVAGVFVYLVSPYLPGIASISISGNIALSLGILVYFITQFVLFSRN